ncbi:MAG: CpaF family protein [Candidatus Paracaedimonas acanthamoebae]|uniref:CpaF family protein n=1 Tax=Candidatus Paracaedimonas acanthamoebae TaxID=244581 RepID=A0A8J7TTG2_9PROT|nr:CpaF family protein [Candidatus Paracaedimonas acanthamoebae]
MSGFGRKEISEFVDTAPQKVSLLNSGPTDKMNAVKQGGHSSQENNHYKTKVVNQSPNIVIFKEKVFDRIIKHIDLVAAAKMPSSELRHEIEHYVLEYSEEHQAQVSRKELQDIINDIMDDMVGLGPLEILLKDSTINDILINSYDLVFVERFGKLFKTDIVFRDEKHVLQIAQRIASQVGRRIDELSPMVDARLQDGSRVNIIIPPVALGGASISIRKFQQQNIKLNDLVQYNSLSPKMAEFLKMAAEARLNIIISGGTGAGKTTLLNALSGLIDPSERVVSIEDSAELKLSLPHVVRLESRPSNMEGAGLITISDLLRNALRMRPDRLVIGECRGAEAFDMLQAMNTGHNGSMSTLHSNNTREALHRIENMLLMAGHDFPNQVVKGYIADAIDLIVHVSRMKDGVRRVTQISSVTGLEDNKINIQDVFLFNNITEEKGKIKGDFEFQDLPKKLCEKIENHGAGNALNNFLKLISS